MALRHVGLVRESRDRRRGSGVRRGGGQGKEEVAGEGKGDGKQEWEREEQEVGMGH